jgi:excisionase family DNA binding protein
MPVLSLVSFVEPSIHDHMCNHPFARGDHRDHSRVAFGTKRIEECMSVDEQTFTMTVPEAGRRYFGLSRGASYAAAERGEIPTIRIGRLLRVPIKAMDAMLEAAKPTSKAA